METTPKEIREYLALDGKCPFRDWLKSLKDVQARARIRVRLNRIRLGNLGDCKFVGDGVYELRVNFGSGYRVYWGQIGNSLILLLCAGDKKSQRKDIQIAQKYWQDYQRRSHE